MTHIQNIPHILKFGITHKDSPKANQDYVSIGDNSLISNRESKKIYVNNGEEISTVNQRIILGNFIPFYFGKRMPMLYVIQNGYKGVNKQEPENIVYCVCTLKRIIEEKLDFYFTDGHSTDSLSSCYESIKVSEIRSIVDFNAVKTTDWTLERDLKRKMQAEFLIASDVPANCIEGFICYNEITKEKIVNMGVDKKTIFINPNSYF